MLKSFPPPSSKCRVSRPRVRDPDSHPGALEWEPRVYKLEETREIARLFCALKCSVCFSYECRCNTHTHQVCVVKIPFIAKVLTPPASPPALTCWIEQKL